MFRLPNSKLIALVAVNFFLSLYVLPYFRLGVILPDLSALMVVFFAFYINWKRVPLFGVAVGFIQDLLSPHVFGIEIFVLGTLSLTLCYVIRKIEREDPVIVTAAVFLFTFLYKSLVSLSCIYLNGSYFFLLDFILRSLWVALYTVMSIPLFFPLYRFLTQGGWYRSYGELFE